MSAILLVEDHAIVRSGIRKLLAERADTSLKECATGEAALTALRAGDIVTTGSHTGLTVAPVGAHVVARFAGLGDGFEE